MSTEDYTELGEEGAEDASITVGQLVTALTALDPTGETVVRISLTTGTTGVLFSPFALFSVDAATGDDEDGARGDFTVVGVDFVQAWDLDTFEDLPAGVLTID